MRLLRFSAAVLALAGTAASAATAQDLDSLRFRVAHLLDELRQRDRFPGATAAFVLPDGRIGAAATGWADVEARVPMTPETKMLAASIGKTFVSATALSLAADGRLRLDDPISRWLGRKSWFSRLANGSTTTIRMLGTHSSGVANHVSNPRFITEWREGRARDPDFAHRVADLVTFVLDRPAAFAPGTSYTYTDTGYLLLGLVIEAASGDSFYRLARTRFIEPLGLTSTVASDRREIPGLAVGYAGSNPFGIPDRTGDRVGSMSWNPALEWTGGGFATTTTDLVRWAKALYEGTAIAKPYLDDLFAAGAPPEPGGSMYGFGVRIAETSLGRTYGHGGSIPGFRSQLIYFPTRCIAIAMQVNTSAGPANERLRTYTESIAKVVLEAAASPVQKCGRSS